MRKGLIDGVPATTVTQELKEFWERYSERPPPSRITSRLHELVKLNEQHGLKQLQPSPVSNVQFGAPPTLKGERGSNRYLWVIDLRGIPYIVERPLSDLGDFDPKHTNLTGGEDAYLGGELWFSDNTHLFVSGGSGRYPPIDANQLRDAVRVFKSYRYRVTSLGWDFKNDRAWREYHDD